MRMKAIGFLVLVSAMSSLALGQTPASAPAGPQVYWVDGASPAAADTNPGTADKPWKTIARAGKAAELRPGDTVRIKAGVYRESVGITVSGEAGKPITFESVPGEWVVIKGSEIVRGQWERVSELKDVKEPYPNAFKGVWKIKLGREYFTDAAFAGFYQDPAKGYVSQVFVNDRVPLQKIGPDPVYKDDDGIRRVGKGLEDIINDSFFFDAKDQSLYLRIAGDPAWYSIEAGVRGGVLGVSKAHDVVVRGLECRHNRMPAGQWPMCNVNECQRVLIEGCKFELSDFCGLGVSVSKDCVVRNCELSYNGDTGLNLHKTENCIVEDCRLMFNNYRRFSPGWHCGGMKNIPGNRGSIIRRCEVAYNIDCPGIWFDADNADLQVVDNIVHHNGGTGIFIEINKGAGEVKDFAINKGGGVIGGNLVYANSDRGIYISGSQGMWVVHNTVVDNMAGIVVMPRENPFVVRNDRVLNNLLIRNYVVSDTLTRGCDLTLCIYPPAEQAASGNFSDFNVYANNGWTPTMRNSWNPDNTLANWQKQFGMDLHSRLMPVRFERVGQGFKLLSTQGLDVAGPLPPECKWKSANPSRVGVDRTQWP